MSGNWYAAHTHLHAETRAAAHLERQGFEVFLPRSLRQRRHARRVETVPAPLFPSYLFVRIDTGCQRWRSVNGTMGVKYLLCDGDRPLEVPATVIDGIKARQGADGWIQLDAPPGFAAGDAVQMDEGPLAGLGGVFQTYDDQERVVVLLTLLGRGVKVRVPLASLSPVA